jgi:competence protein ComEC
VGGLGAWLAGERGRLFPWVPVFMGCGSAVWLVWPGEPSVLALWAAFGLALAGLAAWRSDGLVAGPAGAAVLAAAVGFLAIAARSDHVAGPVLDFRYYGPVEGRVVWVDRSGADRLRLTLDQVRLERVAPERVPDRVRVSLHGDGPFVDPVPGMRVMMTAHLSPPDGPVEPGGFDFQRLAWFRSLGAVGYTRNPVLAQAPPPAWEQAVGQLRARLAGAIRAAMPGDVGGLAAAMTTGDRSGISLEATEAMRDSNLYHLVSISGMHMGLLTGFVFFAVRAGLALVPPVAVRVPGKKVAAVVALAAAAFYLALSGGDVPTLRAFVMVAVMLVAVLLDRRAISLRSVALAAVAVLLLTPEAVAEPGFQMSFGATAALVAGFAALHDRGTLRRLPGWARPVVVLLVSSVLAGFATAPFAAAHFNRYADYGLVANLAAAPVMGLVVMPAAVIAALLAPFGAAAPALWAMEQGTAWILWVAYQVTDWPGAVTLLPNPGPHVLPLLAVGGLLMVLLRGWPRLVGLLPVLAALAFWTGPGRPPVLIAGDGGLVGVMGPQGRALSAERGAGFVARVWLENDGDRAAQAEAAARPGLDQGRGFAIGAARGVHLRGKGAETRVAQACAAVQLVVLDRPAAGVPAGCLVIDRAVLARTGPLALWPDGDGWQARATNPDRPRRWTPRPAQGTGAQDAGALAALNAALMQLTTGQVIRKTAAAAGAPGQ